MAERINIWKPENSPQEPREIWCRSMWLLERTGRWEERAAIVSAFLNALQPIKTLGALHEHYSSANYRIWSHNILDTIDPKDIPLTGISSAQAVAHGLRFLEIKLKTRISVPDKLPPQLSEYTVEYIPDEVSLVL